MLTRHWRVCLAPALPEYAGIKEPMFFESLVGTRFRRVLPETGDEVKLVPTSRQIFW